MYVDFGGQGPTTYKQERGINKEMKESSSDGDDDEENSSNE